VNLLGVITKSARERAAVFCLLALVFFYAQATALACAVATGMCCDGDHCPIAAHHHARQAAKPSPSDCGHDMSAMNHSGGESHHAAGQMSACSMSCCQTQSTIAFHAPTYLVPPAFVTDHGMRETPLQLVPDLKILLLAAVPPAPPPKLSTQIA
jgi:hypothetical protein